MRIMKLPFTFFPSRTLVEIESDFDLNQSIERLHDATLCESGSRDRIGPLAGQVGADRVKVSRRQSAYYLNRGEPILVGNWEQRDGRVFLVGRFGMHRDMWIAIGMTLFCFAWIVFFRFLNLMDENLLQFFLELPIIAGFGSFWVGIYIGCRWLARDDETYILSHVRHVLRK